MSARIVRFDGVNHGYFALTRWVERAETAMITVTNWLKTLASSA